jgi:hypothetical protein
MGRMPLTEPERARLLLGWRDTPGMLGVRVTLQHEPLRGAFLDGESLAVPDADKGCGPDARAGIRTVTVLAPVRYQHLLTSRAERSASSMVPHPGRSVRVIEPFRQPSVALSSQTVRDGGTRQSVAV